MAFDQSSILKDLRSLNVAQNIAEEPLVLPVNSTGRTVECYPPNSVRDVGSPGSSVPLFYPAPVSDASIVGIGYGNAVSCASVQCSSAGMPIAHTAVVPAVRFNYGPNFGLGGNAPSHTFMATGPGYALNLGNLVGGNGVDKAVSDAANGINYGASQGSRIIGNASDQADSIVPPGSNYSPTLGHRAARCQASEEGDDSLSGRKVKFLCSYGGKILPRPSDGMLRYVGGVTRIISFKTDVNFKEMAQKMADTYGQPVVIKYQLPDEDLDALVSVSCPDDLENMMDEYGRLVEGSADGSSKLRVFLFSALELDSSNAGQFGDVDDSAQRYVDAVNGIARKESITSETSTQNSDFSGSEALGNYSMPGQVDISGAVSSCMSSPKENVAASHDTAAKLVGTDHGPIYSDAFAIPLGLLVPNSGHARSSPFQIEVDVDRSIPPTFSQQQFLLQQSMINIPPAAPYLQPFVDPHQEVTNHSDYVQLPPQTGLPNPAFLGRAAPIFTPQQLYDKNPGLPSHQVIPSLQITMAPPTSHVAARPNITQPLMQPQKNLMDYENTSGPRIMQVPIEHNYNAYQVQVPPTVVGGNCGRVQVSPQEQVIFSDVSSPHQQVVIPDKIQKLEDCYMCQKTLPHAHSDPVAVVQDQPDGGASPVSDSIPSYHSLPMEDVLKSQATNQGGVTQPPNESIIEQGFDIRPKVISKGEPLVGVPCTDTTGLPHNYEPLQGERTYTQKSDGSNHLANKVVQAVIGRAGDKQSESPVENWTERDLLVNRPIINDMCPVSTPTVETSECMVQESPKDYTNELACIVSKADTVDNWVISNHLRATDGKVDTLGVYNPEGYVENDHCKLPVDKPNENDIMDHKTQLPVEKEMLLDNNFGKSNMVLDSNQNNLIDMLPCSYAEISYGHNSRPVECTEMAQPPFWGISESNPQLKTGHHHKDDTVPSSSLPSSRGGDVQDSSNSLFSNQDPWNIHHDTYHPPPRSNKVALKKENYLSKDHFGENASVNYDKQSLEAQLDGGLSQPFKQNLSIEHGLAEDPIIRQELQAVAEGVAASVLHSSRPPNPDLHTGDMPGEEDIEEGNFKDKASDAKNKSPENPNFGFPISAGLGRLQIIKNCDLEELRELGSGTFGTVYHGKWRGSDVAIKRINDRCFCGKPSEQDRMRADFWNEAIKLADLHHPNVLAFYGVVLDGPGGTVATVTEYMVNGSLRNALQKNERILDRRKRLLIAMDVAFGLEYLHGKNIVHFDLKSDNLLVNLRDPHRPICKVGDLGLSKAKCQTLISGGVRGTLPWMAPELLNGSSSLVSEKVDVFSFGIVMWELLTGEEPYADLFYGAIIGGIVSNTLRPRVPESCNPEWRWLMERCWSSEPSERPSFTEIADELRLMAAKSPRKAQHQQQQSPSSHPHVQK